MAPPAGKPGAIPRARMPIVNKTTSYASRAAIQVLIAAPHCKVAVPVMKSQLQIAGGVCQIKANHAASGVTGASDTRDIKRLACGVVHASQHDQRDLVSFALDYVFDVVLANARFAGAW